MYRGYWSMGISYKRGDIVYADHSKQYFICSREHASNSLMYPSNEDLYWIVVSDVFINSLNPNINRNTSVATGSNTIPLGKGKPIQPLVTSERNITLKRKLRTAERSIESYKRNKRTDDMTDLRDRLLLLDIDVSTKSFIIDKYDNARRMTGSEYSKTMSWFKTVASIPYGRYKQLRVRSSDTVDKLKEFFENIKTKLDKHIYGLEDVKQEILEYIARKITNPHGKGDVLALCGPPGTAKTKIIKTLAEAMDLPFHQINFGGLNDVSILTGHSETYIGSKTGKIVEILVNSQYMNPIIYLDEIDKICEGKSVEINGVLTHLLDEEQNNKFQDNYLSNVPLNLSKAFFVIAFNDISKVDDIVKDRMKIIYIEKPSTVDKLSICKDKMIPDIIKTINFNKDHCIQIDEQIIEYIIQTKCDTESGVRKLKKCIEKILNRLNYDILIDNTQDIIKEQCKQGETVESAELTDEKTTTTYKITKKYVDSIIRTVEQDISYLSMYT